ncbi:transposase [Francisella noatunensis]
MTKSNIIELKDTLENEFKDTLTDLVRTTAKAAIQEAINAEVTEFINDYKNMKLEDGKQQVVRNGYNPERIITTGIGSVKVKMPKVRDRKKSGISFYISN